MPGQSGDGEAVEVPAKKRHKGGSAGGRGARGAAAASQAAPGSPIKTYTVARSVLSMSIARAAWPFFYASNTAGAVAAATAAASVATAMANLKALAPAAPADGTGEAAGKSALVANTAPTEGYSSDPLCALCEEPCPVDDRICVGGGSTVYDRGCWNAKRSFDSSAKPQRKRLLSPS